MSEEAKEVLLMYSNQGLSYCQLFSAESTGGTPDLETCVSMGDQGDDMRKWDGELTRKLEGQVQELKENHYSQMEKFLLQCLPGRVEEWIVHLILMKGPLVRSYKKNQVMYSPMRNRGVLPLGRWRRGTTGFTKLCRFCVLAHQPPLSMKF